jgi:hypothetical protein
MYLSPRSFINQPVTALSTHAIGQARGFLPLYHADIQNRCPGCGKSHWNVGRLMAECAFCETALPLAITASQPMEPRFMSRNSETAH